MKILITGMSGVGKSTLCKHLSELGYKSFDLDDIPGLCNLYHPDGTVVGTEENRVELDMLETDYLCDTDKLHQHIDGQTGNIFYLGFVDNFSEVAKYFDKVLLLTTTPEETLIIGDAKTDIIAGKTTNTITCLFTPSDNKMFYDFDVLRATEPDFEITSQKQLIEIVTTTHQQSLENSDTPFQSKRFSPQGHFHFYSRKLLKN